MEIRPQENRFLIAYSHEYALDWIKKEKKGAIT